MATKEGKKSYKELQRENALPFQVNAPTFSNDNDNKIVQKLWSNSEAPAVAYDRHQVIQSPMYNTGRQYGESSYDPNVLSQTDFDVIQRNPNEIRALNQSAFAQVANGFGKMITTAITTFLGDTVGLLWGVGQGIANASGDDPNKGFWRGIWDNDFSNAMADIQEDMESILPNYMTQEEQDKAWYEKMFSSGAANFWGDGILKNAGFTIGSAAAIWATWGLGALGKAVKLGGLASKAATGLRLAKMTDAGLQATKVGKVLGWTTKTWLTTNGEAAVEALNATRDNKRLMEQNLANRQQQLLEQAQNEYDKELLNATTIEEENAAKANYDAKVNKIDQDMQAYRNQMEKELSDAGNIIYAANVAALSISNNLTLGSLIRGGYKNSSSLLSNAIKTVGGKPVKGVEDAAKALMKGELRLDTPALKNVKKKVLGHYLLESSQEGIEEGVQNLASTTGQMVAQARMNDWASTNTMLGNMINPDAEDELQSYFSALSKAWSENFGALNSQGWTEAAMGFISGALGVPGLKRRGNGKYGVGWQGGLSESIEAVTGTNKQLQQQVTLINDALTKNKFGERIKHAVNQLAIKKAMDQALDRDDIQTFKNLELQQLVSDGVFFRNAGMLDEYLEMYKQLNENVSDQDVQELRAALTPNVENSPSLIQNMSDDEIKKLYKDKAKSTLDKVTEALDDYETFEKKYGHDLTDTTRHEGLIELTYLSSLVSDIDRRGKELEDQAEELEYKEKRSASEDKKLETTKKAIEELEKQREQVNDKLEDYLDDPKSLVKEVDKRNTIRQKIKDYKEAEKAIAKYKEAKTLKDAIDIYTYSPVESRDKVIEQAVAQTEDPEVKSKLQELQTFTSDVQVLDQLIQDKFSKLDPSNPRKFLSDTQYSQLLNSLLNNIVSEMIEDETPVLDRASMKKRLQKVLEDNQKELKEAEDGALGVTLAEDGSVSFGEEPGVTDDDFIEVLDNPDTGETHREIAEGSTAQQKVENAYKRDFLKGYVSHINELLNSLDKIDDLKKAARIKAEKAAAEKAKAERLKTKTKTKAGTTVEDDVTISDDGEEFTLDDEDSQNETSKLDTSKKFKLSDDESKAFDATDVVQNGVSYITISPAQSAKSLEKEELQKLSKGVLDKYNKGKQKIDSIISAIESLDTNVGSIKDTDTGKEESAKQETSKEKTEKAKKIGALLNELFQTLIENPVMAKDVKTYDAFIQKYKQYIKPTSANQAASVKEKGKEVITAENNSFGGNQFNAYKNADLKKGNMIKNEQRNDMLNLITAQIQYVQDYCLNKLLKQDKDKKPEERTPIYYVRSTENPNIVFLAVNTENIDNNVWGDSAKTSMLNITHNNKSYKIIGTLGYSSALGTVKDSYQKIYDNLNTIEASAIDTNSGKAIYAIDTEHTNRIKWQSDGFIVNRNLEDKETKVRELSDLLDDPNRNPLALTFSDLGWIVVEGTEDKPTLKTFNTDNKEYYNVAGRPGQVYMLIPTTNGKYVPVYMNTPFFKELDKATPLYTEIRKVIEDLATGSIEDKKYAIARLNDLLIFSRANQIHLNDDSYTKDPNTIYTTTNGVVTKIADFKDDSPINVEDILNAIELLNPRINISTTILNKPDEAKSLYLDSGVLQTDIAMLHTVGSTFYVYPTDDSLNWRENKIPAKKDNYKEGSPIKRIIYLNGNYVRVEEKDGAYIFYNKDGQELDDSKGELTFNYEIHKGEHKPIYYNDKPYYKKGKLVYAPNGHGGYVAMSYKQSAKIIAGAAKQKKKNQHLTLAQLQELYNGKAVTFAKGSSGSKGKITVTISNFDSLLKALKGSTKDAVDFISNRTATYFNGNRDIAALGIPMDSYTSNVDFESLSDGFGQVNGLYYFKKSWEVQGKKQNIGIVSLYNLEFLFNNNPSDYYKGILNSNKLENVYSNFNSINTLLTNALKEMADKMPAEEMKKGLAPTIEITTQEKPKIPKTPRENKPNATPKIPTAPEGFEFNEDGDFIEFNDFFGPTPTTPSTPKTPKIPTAPKRRVINGDGIGSGSGNGNGNNGSIGTGTGTNSSEIINNFAEKLGTRQNKEQRKELMQIMSEKTGKTIDSANSLAQALDAQGIDLSSGDINDIIDIVKNCRN